MKRSALQRSLRTDATARPAKGGMGKGMNEPTDRDDAYVPAPRKPVESRWSLGYRVFRFVCLLVAYVGLSALVFSGAVQVRAFGVGALVCGDIIVLPYLVYQGWVTYGWLRDWFRSTDEG